jgi:hypothetical protein
MTEEKINNIVIDIIIEFIKATQKGENRNERIINYIDENKKDYTIYNTKYLLGQIVRQYKISKDKIHVSKAARELWDKLTTQNIFEFEYDEIVVCDNIKKDYIEVNLYKGAAKIPHSTKQIFMNEKIIFNDVFHREHTITIHDIINEMLKLRDKELNYTNISNILDKIHICYLLKSEDRSIKKGKSRGLEYLEVVEKYYKPNGIEVIE